MVPEQVLSQRRWLLLLVLGAAVVMISVVLWVIMGRNGIQEEADEAVPVPAAVEIRSDPGAGSQWTESSIWMRFRYIPAGSFMMGSNEGDSDEKPVHEVTISRGFWMGQTEVTQGQWRRLMGSNRSGSAGCGDDCPVENVSWNDAVKYANALSTESGLRECYRVNGKSVSFVGLQCEGYRLPTEAEWEYAAGAGSQSKYAGSNDIGAVAWYANNADGKTHRVGTKAANAWGLRDMSGNVWEWCWDWNGAYPSGSVSDPKGPSTGSDRVGRGGSWLLSARFCRSAYRFRGSPGERYGNLGFRLVRTAR